MPSHPIALEWPTKNQAAVEDENGKWSLRPEPDTLEVVPLDLVETIGAQPPSSMVVLGERLSALRTLRRFARRGVRLAYLDLPRLEGFDETRAFQVDEARRWNTWLSVLRSHVRAVRRLLADDAVIVVQAGDAEEPYAKAVLLEELDHSNYVGTILWQSHYSPKGGKPGTEIAAIHESLICVAHDRSVMAPVALTQTPEGYENPDGDPRGPWKAPQKDAGRDTVKLTYYVPPYRWQIVDGELPTGLWRVSPFSGAIWGLPTEAGSWSFKVAVEDQAGSRTTKTLTVDIEETGDAPDPPSRVWWMDAPPKESSRPPRITSRSLPSGVRGMPYSAVLMASGGSPVSRTKRPSRGWGFGEKTLIAAILEDRCYFGKKGDAIPEPKRYLADLEEGVSKTNVTSWWDGATAGWSQDATKHLRALRDAGVIDDTVETAKPEALLARLLDAFTQPGDRVVEVFSQSGDLAATAMKTGRRFISLSGQSPRAKDLVARVIVPRLRGILSGADSAVPGSATAAVGLSDTGFAVVETGQPIAVRAMRIDEIPRFLPSDRTGDELAVAVLSAEGYLPIDTSGFAQGINLNGTEAAVALPPAAFLDNATASELALRASDLSQPTVVYYFRAAEDFSNRGFDEIVSFRRVPMDFAA